MTPVPVGPPRAGAPASTRAFAPTQRATDARPAGEHPARRAEGRDAGPPPAEGGAQPAGQAGQAPADERDDLHALLAEPPALPGALPPPELPAWQAALGAQAARLAAQAATPAGALAGASATQQAVAAGAQAAEAGAALAAGGLAAPLVPRVEVELRTGAGPAWVLSAQRAPDALSWTLGLGTPALPPAWAGTQLPQLTRRLRARGHAVEELAWLPGQSQGRGGAEEGEA